MMDAGAGEARQIDIRMLRLFDVLYETRSVTRAAEHLGWSQPTVSTWLARLRQGLHDPLFVRTASGMQPTPRADGLIGACRAALASIDQLLDQSPQFDPATSRRVFRICMTDASHVTLLPRLLGSVQAVAPDIRLNALRIGPETPGLLLSGEADLALGLLPQLDTGFYQQRLFRQDWVCLVRPGHPLVDSEDRLAGYAEAAHLSVASGASQRLLDEALNTRGISRRVRLELPGFLGLASVLTASDLVATLPRLIGRILGETSNLSVLDCPLPVAGFEVRQHWHERFHHDPANQWLRGLCASLFQQTERG
jgi:DNA-binding transcriptional LysR family regulator